MPELRWRYSYATVLIRDRPCVIDKSGAGAQHGLAGQQAFLNRPIYARGSPNPSSR